MAGVYRSRSWNCGLYLNKKLIIITFLEQTASLIKISEPIRKHRHENKYCFDIYIYIYIYRERERESGRWLKSLL